MDIDLDINDHVKWKIPLYEKIYEAYTAVADDRVTMFVDHAFVWSSDHTKKYIIEWNDNVYASNDNASYYQGYMGYPVVAVLIQQGKITYSPEAASYFKGINWKELNTQHKRKYSKVVELIMNDLAEKGVDIQMINNDVESIYKQIMYIDIRYRRSKHHARMNQK